MAAGRGVAVAGFVRVVADQSSVIGRKGNPVVVGCKSAVVGRVGTVKSQGAAGRGSVIRKAVVGRKGDPVEAGCRSAVADRGIAVG